MNYRKFRNKHIVISIVSIILLALIANKLLLKSGNVSKNVVESKEKPVKTMKLEEKTKSTYLDYIGTVNSNEIKKLGFKNGGKINKVNVKKGQKITKGTVLATLEEEDLSYAIAGSKAQLDGAIAQHDKAVNGVSQEELNRAKIDIEKAENAYNQSLSDHKRYEKLLESGIATKQDFENSQLQVNTRRSDLDKAKEAYAELQSGTREEDKRVLASQIEQARADYNHKQSMLKDSTMTSDIDGYVVDVLYKEGEFTAPGHPVVVVRGETQVVNIGVTQADISEIEIGNTAKAYADDIETSGVITNISEMPDEETRTYNVEITLDENLFKLGAVTNIDINLGEQKGIWIPIKAVKSGNKDYVFVSENNKAKRKNIKIKTTKDFQVRVEGLKNGDNLVIEGMDRLLEGDILVKKK